MAKDLNVTNPAPEAWDAFLQSADGAWFWHSSAYQTYAKAYRSKQILADLSFAMEDDQGIVAACPAHLEMGTPVGENEKQVLLGGSPAPFPAIRADLPERRRLRVEAACLQELEKRARNAGAAMATLRRSALVPGRPAGQREAVNPMLEHGWTDLPWLTQVIDLRAGKDTAWAGMRKATRQAIKAAQAELSSRVIDSNAFDGAAFDAYQRLHAKDAGRVTRPAATFAHMKKWVEDGKAILVEASDAESPIAFALILLHRQGAFYGSGCREPDRPELTGQHLVQWTAIQWLANAGFQAYETGIQQLGPQWFDVPSEKDRSISFFKRGFGGSTVPLHTGERHFDEAHGRRLFEWRLDRWWGAS